MKPIEKVQKSNNIQTQPHNHVWIPSKDGTQVCKLCGKTTNYNARFNELLAHHLAA